MYYAAHDSCVCVYVFTHATSDIYVFARHFNASIRRTTSEFFIIIILSIDACRDPRRVPPSPTPLPPHGRVQGTYYIRYERARKERDVRLLLGGDERRDQ